MQQVRQATHTIRPILRPYGDLGDGTTGASRVIGPLLSRLQSQAQKFVMTMTFEDSIVIDTEPATLFWLSQDYCRRLEWDPFLRSAQLVGDAREAAVGVRAVCVSRSGWEMETEYVSFNPPQTTAIKMTRGPWFLETFAGSWRFEQLSFGQTRVHFTYHLRARPRWLAWLLMPILMRSFRRDTRQRLLAMKAAAEQVASGQASQVGQEGS